MYILFLFFDNPSYQTAIHIFARKKCEQRANKNAPYIASYLSCFLYEVIKKNDIVDIPVSDTSINYSGYAIRKNSVIYRFIIPVADMPDVDEYNLQKILQNTVIGQLNHYGITGLSSVYQDTTTIVPSVYIDRILYSEEKHLVAVDVLYICTSKDLLYYQNAVRENNNKNKAERTVYDDEV